MPKPLLPAGVDRPSITSFLKSVLRSGLMDRAELRTALRESPADRRADPAALAEHLIRMGKLSRFQAGKLLQGVSSGLLLGPYQVLAPIGKGGMSTVYLGRDSRNQQLVALKVLPPKRARQQERHLVRFLREMEICQRVAHAHLACTHEVGIEQGVYYIAMEFIPGKSLYRLVSEEGPLVVPRAARLFAEVAAGLEHAHRQGLVHRDLKPSNILITPHDHAKVLDLGLALIQGEIPLDRTILGGQGYVVGTMDYVAPEQSEDAAKVDGRADIYGLGCTLYFALTGRPPFPGRDALQKIMRHRTEEPALVCQLNPAVPPAFDAIVQKMMAKRPEQRFASAMAVREELVPWTSGESILPLDQAGDLGYQTAMAALEAGENALDLRAEAVPVTPAKRAPRRRQRLAPMSLLHSVKSPRETALPSWPVYLLPLIVGACVVALGVIAVLYVLEH